MESFNSRARDELLARAIFGTVLEAKVLAEDWRRAHDIDQLQSAMGFQVAAIFSAAFRESKLSQRLDLAPISYTKGADMLVM